MREDEDIACTPSSAACVLLRGTLLFSRMKAPDGSNWTVARSTEWTVRLALATSCAEACASSAASLMTGHAEMNVLS